MVCIGTASVLFNQMETHIQPYFVEQHTMVIILWCVTLNQDYASLKVSILTSFECDLHLTRIYGV